MKTESDASKYIADMLRGCREIKIHAMEESTNLSFGLHVDRIREHGVIQSMRNLYESIKVEIIQYAGIAVIYLSGGYFCIYKNMEIGTFFAFIASINVLMHPIMSMMQINLIRGNAEAGMERISRIMQIQKSTKELPPEKQASYSKERESAQNNKLPCIEFKHVAFSYDGNTQTIKDISCVINDKESVALVGPSGSGKTTFIFLIQRLYDVQKGQIILNGKNIKQYSLKAIRSAFGTVSQSPFMFQGTVLENIKISNPGASDDEVSCAIEMAYINEFIDQLPNGLQTQVGEDGFGLSGGQHQRITIARALLSKPDYFIFDEATSDLDNRSERKIQDAMEELMKTHTTLIIAHRLSTIRNVDKILVFLEGRIVQCGTYKELAQRDGLFKDLLDQSSNEMLV
jgi:ATP-binding cassette subfamily B protein